MKAVRAGSELCSFNALKVRSVQVDIDCNAITGIPAVVQVIAIPRVVHINIVVVVPIVGPVFRPRVNHSEPIAAVLEAGITANDHHGVAVDSEPVTRTKVAMRTLLRNPIAVIAAALLPVTVLRLPVVCSMLLPSASLFAFLPVLLLLGLHLDLLCMGLLL